MTVKVGTEKQLSGFYGTSSSPVIATSNNYVYIAWSDSGSQTASKTETLFRRSIDGGATFNDAVNLSAGVGAESGAQISIGVSGNNVYIAWHDFRMSDNDIQYRRSTDNSATFESTVNLSNTDGKNIWKNIWNT